MLKTIEVNLDDIQIKRLYLVINPETKEVINAFVGAETSNDIEFEINGKDLYSAINKTYTI